MANDMKKALQEKAKRQAATKDSSGSGIKALNLTKDHGPFKPVAGRNKVDIIPYLAGKNNPDKSTKPGEPTYVLDYWVHRNVGLNHDSVVCPAKNFHKPCPICEEMETMRAAGKDWKEEIKPLAPTRRVAYNFINLLGDKKKILVFDAPHFFFEKELLDEAMSDDGADIVDFFSLDSGKTVCFKAVEEAFQGNKFFKFKSFSFEDREGYPESFIKKAYCLDDLLNILSYNQINDIFFGSGVVADDPDAEDDDDDEKASVADDDEEPEEAVEEKPKSSKKSKKSDDDDNECPHGHKFGKDYEEFDDCDNCDKWKQCM